MTRWQKLKAKIKGHKITECPKCYRLFLAHERHEQVKIRNIHYRFVCKNCYKT